MFFIGVGCGGFVIDSVGLFDVDVIMAMRNILYMVYSHLHTMRRIRAS